MRWVLFFNMVVKDIYRNASVFYRLLFLAMFLILSSGNSRAQVKVYGGFLSDSVKIGEETAFYLSAKYPENATILFPDSSHQFAPFEYTRRKYYPTETKNGVSSDSTLYFLNTFELDRLQVLRLPVYMVNERDSTLYFSTMDTVRLIQLVKESIDSIKTEELPLKMNTAYHKVNFEFNYFILLIVVGALVIIASIVWIIFGKRISHYLQVKRLRKKHEQFIAAYIEIVNRLQQAFSPTGTETALSLWKKYMEQLEAKPYTKLTSPETVRLHPDEQLGKNLGVIDRAIYGRGNGVIEPLQHLKAVADQHFLKKLEEVKHGK